MSHRGPSRLGLLGRLLRETLRPPGATGPVSLRRLVALTLFVPAFLLLQGLHWIGFLLDEVLFPGYRRVEVEEPLFVVGLPRSGTSFFQRVLADDPRFTTLRLWELLLAPSVTERRLWLALGAVDRRLGRPLGRARRGLERLAFRWMDDVHPVSLDEPEEDYFLLLPVFACFLLVVPFPYHSALWRLARFDEMPAGERARILAFYRSCLQRHLHVVGDEKRLLSKNPSFTPMIASLADAFPDARFVCCVRDPREAVPSLLSALRGGAALFGWEPADPEVRDRFVELMAWYARHALATLDDMDDARRAYAPLDDLRRDLAGLVEEIYGRFGWSVPPPFRERLARRSRHSRTHTSRHRYSLEEFGLRAPELGMRFQELDARFGFGEPASPAGPGPGDASSMATDP